MDLSHQSITGHQFELNRRGYDPDTVDAHLAEIAGAVANREREMAELKTTIESLQAKVQDANESEEALRLTLKAAAHAKEELLAGAREQAKTMEAEAAANSEQLVAEATAKAEQLVSEATTNSDRISSETQARVNAMEEGARSRAGEVAKAALAESEALVARIEGLRASLQTAERALESLQTHTAPQMDEARAALDAALAGAREAAEDPAVLAQSAAVREAVEAEAQPAAQGPPEGDGTPTAEPIQPSQPSGEQQTATPGDVVEEAAVPVTPPPEFPETQPIAEAIDEPKAGEVEAAGTGDLPEGFVPEEQKSPAAEETPAPHLEVVAPPDAPEPEESSADISDKVDRLLEELREVT